MITKIGKPLCGLFLVFMLAACSSHVQSTEKLAEMSRDDFMKAVRWKQFQVASSLMLPEYRQDFLTTFADVKDIHITDVRLIDLKPTAEGRRFETTIEMDYYLLPSVSLKTFRFAQTWVYFDGEGTDGKGFFITTSFPDFP